MVSAEYVPGQMLTKPGWDLRPKMTIHYLKSLDQAHSLLGHISQHSGRRPYLKNRKLGFRGRDGTNLTTVGVAPQSKCRALWL